MLSVLPAGGGFLPLSYILMYDVAEETEIHVSPVFRRFVFNVK